MPVVHELKTLPVYFDAVERGEKTFEVRRDDRGFQKGDTVRLLKFAPGAGYVVRPDRPGGFAGPAKRFTSLAENAVALERRIIWVLTDGFEGLQPGFVVLALGPVEQPVEAGSA